MNKNYLIAGIAVLVVVLVVVVVVHNHNAVAPGSQYSEGSGITPPSTQNGGSNPGSNPTSPTTYPSTPSTPGSTAPAPVPAIYQSLYNSMQTSFNHYQAEVASNPTPYPVNYSATLLDADSNAGTAILTSCPTPSKGSNCPVDQELNALQALGVKAVMTEIGFPVFDADFYTNVGLPTSTAQAFLNYYIALSQDIHSRGLKFIVEANPLLTVSGYTSHALNPAKYYPTLTWDEYLSLRSQHNQIVAEQIKPDYLILESEPTQEVTDDPTFAPDFNTPTNNAAMLQSFVNDLNNAGVNHSVTEIGAGMGTWQPNYQQWVNAFTAIKGLDSIDCHIYFVGNYQSQDEISIAMNIADMAHAAGKKASIAEFWPHASAQGQKTGPSSNDLKAMDSFSFWAPLDEQFFQTMVKLANEKQLDYLSAFDSSNFFANLNYNSAPCQLAYPASSASENLSCDSQIDTAAATLVKQAMSSNPVQLSPLGEAYKADIAAN